MTTSRSFVVREAVLDAVSDALADALGPTARITHAGRSPYSTSHTIYDIDAVVEGRPFRLVLKDLSPAATLAEARGKRPSLVDDPAREVTVYRTVLSGTALGTASCVAASSDPETDEHWLLLERVPGVELYQLGDVRRWEEAAAWLGRVHVELADVALDPPDAIPCHDAAYYLAWAERTADFARHWDVDRRRAARWLLDRHAGVAEAVAALPATFIHGECYASNVLLDSVTGRVCAVDWEMAAVGPGLLDLAALTAGWPPDEQLLMSVAYHRALGAAAPSLDRLLADLDRCRLQLHMQWLGWSRDWTPPPEHRRDWLAEAVAVAERLGL